MMWKRKAATREATRVAASPDNALTRAEEAHIRGDYEVAAAGYRHVLGDAYPLQPATRVRVLRQMTEVHHLLGYSDKADVVSAEAVQLARQLGGSPLAEALWNAGYVAWCRKDLETARGVLEEAVELARVHDEPPNNRDLGPALLNLARVSFSRGEWDRGRELIDELMTLVTFGAAAHQAAGTLALEEGDWKKAESYFERALVAAVKDEKLSSRLMLAYAMLMMNPLVALGPV